MENTEAKLFSAAWWKQMGWLNLGTLLMAVGVYFFKFPNHFTTGGVSGISIVVAHFMPSVTTATLNLILNIILLGVGVLFLGRSFGLRTAYSAIVSSVLTYVFERAVPMTAPMTSQPVLELMFAVGLPAFGSAILFHVNASSGGTDIIAMLVKKYSHMHIGLALGRAVLPVRAVPQVLHGGRRDGQPAHLQGVPDRHRQPRPHLQLYHEGSASQRHPH